MLLALRWATVSTDDLDPISIRVVDKGNVLLTAEISINFFRKHLSIPHPSIHIFPFDWCGITAAFAASEPASHSLRIPLRIKYPPPPPFSPPVEKELVSLTLILPSSGLFLNLTPSSSNRLQAASRLSTLIQTWPKPRPGSSLPEA